MAESDRTAGETFIDRVETKLDELGISARAFSLQVTGKPDFMRDIKRRGHLPSASNLDHVADVLGVTTDWLVGRSEVPGQVGSEARLADVAIPWRGRSPEEPGIPLVGTGDCADLEVCTETGDTVQVERSSFDPEYHVRYLARPPALRGATDLYAIYFQGESMVPRFEPNEVGIVDPRRGVSPGDYVVVQLRDGESEDVGGVLVKRLVRKSASEVVLEQLNPALTFTLSARQVKRMHRIIPQTDLLF